MRRLLPWLALSLTLLAVGTAWLAAHWSAVGRPLPVGPPPPSSSPQLLPPHRPPEPDPRFRWPTPEPLEPGPRWVYGVFTPPRLYLESPSEGGPPRFRWAPPAPGDPAESEEPATFGIRLVRAEPVPSRFQVVGVAASGKEAGRAGPLVLFADLASPPDEPRVFGLVPGEANPAKGLQLEAVERVVREPARGGVEVDYLAKVRLGAEGVPRRLSSRSTHTVGNPRLIFAPTDAAAPTEIRGPSEGGVFAVGERRYRVERIDPAADLVRVSRLDEEGDPRWTKEWRLSGSPGEPAPARAEPSASPPPAASSPRAASPPDPGPS